MRPLKSGDKITGLHFEREGVVVVRGWVDAVWVDAVNDTWIDWHHLDGMRRRVLRDREGSGYVRGWADKAAQQALITAYHLFKL